MYTKLNFANSIPRHVPTRPQPRSVIAQRNVRVDLGVGDLVHEILCLARDASLIGNIVEFWSGKA